MLISGKVRSTSFLIRLVISLSCLLASLARDLVSLLVLFTLCVVDVFINCEVVFIEESGLSGEVLDWIERDIMALSGSLHS